ncbi:MAG: hypothetical protein ACJAYU_002670 [Bradymonadia bacterium]
MLSERPVTDETQALVHPKLRPEDLSAQRIQRFGDDRCGESGRINDRYPQWLSRLFSTRLEPLTWLDRDYPGWRFTNEGDALKSSLPALSDRTLRRVLAARPPSTLPLDAELDSGEVAHLGHGHLVWRGGE